MSDLSPGSILEALLRIAAGILSLLAVTVDPGPSGDGPEMVGGAYALPAGDEVVIRIAENNGSVSPEFQTGYAVEIDASGHAEYVYTPEGASSDLIDPATEPLVTVANLGEDGVQTLLRRLASIGIFAIANPDDEAPLGASVDLLEVTLGDGTWLIRNVGADTDDAARLDLAQALVVATVRSAPVE